MRLFVTGGAGLLAGWLVDRVPGWPTERPVHSQSEPARKQRDRSSLHLPPPAPQDPGGLELAADTESAEQVTELVLDALLGDPQRGRRVGPRT